MCGLSKRKFDTLAAAKACMCPAFGSNKRLGNSCQECSPPFHLHSSALTQVFFSGKDVMEFQLDISAIFMHGCQLKALRFSIVMIRY